MFSSFIGHVCPGIMFFVMATWWLVNIAYRYHSAPYTNTPFKSTLSFQFRFLGHRAGDWPLECYARIVIAIFLSAYIPTQAFTVDCGFSRYFFNPHTGIFSVFAASGVAGILTYHGIPIPPEMERALFGVGYAVEAAMVGLHLVGRGDIDVLIHTLAVYLCLASSVVTLAEISFPRSYLLSFARCFLMAHQGSWWLQIGWLADYEGINSFDWDDAREKLEVEKSLSYFVFHGLLNLTVFLFIAGLVKMVVWKRRHKLSMKLSKTESESENDFCEIRAY